MPAIIIVAFVAGLAWSLGAAWIGKRLVRKMRFSQPDRDLLALSSECSTQVVPSSVGKSVDIATAGARDGNEGEDRDLLCAGFIFESSSA